MIYIGLYVDDIIYYSRSNKVEQWFKNNLKLHIKVDFMGDASWFLGQRFDLHTDESRNISCHVLHQAMIKSLLDNTPNPLEHHTVPV